MSVWIIKCRKCGSFEVIRYYDVIISCLDCGCVFVLGKEMIYDPEMEVKTYHEKRNFKNV